ncbi:MAG: hypothetical protein A2W29_08185 [Gemmatimonadetes bacterium RBG_16_66_8]|nr:MAG: hypothetical protein A2W29_08185 [Gemmatimonadetes bacterium RBG_16_66_8]
MSPSTIVRTVLAGGTAVFAALGLVFRDDPRWFAASGLCGLLWGGWGFLSDYAFGPLGEWASGLFARVPGDDLAALRPNIEQTVRTLEARLEAGEGRESDLRMALVLEELHRKIRHDPVSAARVVALVRDRYPDAPELKSRHPPAS